MTSKTIYFFGTLLLSLVLSACGLVAAINRQDLLVNNKCSSSMDIFLDSTKLGLAVRGEKALFSVSSETHTVKAFLLNGTLFTQQTIDFSKGSYEWILCP